MKRLPPHQRHLLKTAFQWISTWKTELCKDPLLLHEMYDETIELNRCFNDLLHQIIVMKDNGEDVKPSPGCIAHL